MLLIFPPIAKPGEPPAGIARLSGALKHNGIRHHILDANIEGILYLLNQPHKASDTWSRRALKNISNNLTAIRDIRTYQSPDRYQRAVKDINRVLAISADRDDVLLGLADYQDQRLAPLRSADLIAAAEHPEKNPFYPWFRKRLPEVLEKALSPRRRQEREEKHGDREYEKNPPPSPFPKGGNRSAQDSSPFFKEGSGYIEDFPPFSQGGLGGFTSGKDAAHVVGFSLNYLSQALCTFAMIGYIRKEFPDFKIILGGGLVSSWMKRPDWKDPFSGLVDRLIAGPGEEPLLSLHGIENKRQNSYTPDYDSLTIHDYLSPGFILPYSGSSGCYWNKCSFCPERAEDNPYIPVPVEQAITDLNALTDKHKPVLIHLLDNSISPALMDALAEKPLGVPWYGFARISKELMDFDYCTALKRSGCVMLKLGLESGDQGVLDRMQKGIDLSTASLVLKNLKKAGIATYAYLLFGTPAETITEARKTLDFIVRHQEAITFLNLAIFNMPLCGHEAQEYEIEQFYEGDLSLYTGFKHPRGWDRKFVRHFLDDEFKRHPVVAAILKNDPPVFTSNHAAFFAKP